MGKIGGSRIKFSQRLETKTWHRNFNLRCFFQLNHLNLHYVILLFPYLLFPFLAEIMDDYATTNPIKICVLLPYLKF